MPKEMVRKGYIHRMREFVRHATGEWAEKAKAFIAELEAKLASLTDEAFRQLLLAWDNLVGEAPEEVHMAYARS